MKKWKKTALTISSYAVVAALAVGGTVAMLTDRNTATNVFTVGDVEIQLNEDFIQGSELMPGVKIEKEVSVENVGENDAWVWFTYATPVEASDPTGVASKNPVHINIPGRYWDIHRTNSTYWAEGQIEAVALEDTWHWNGFDDEIHVINGEEYYMQTVLYNRAIGSGEITNLGLETVYLDSHVDYNKNDGKYYWVDGGNATLIDYDFADYKIYVAAYAVQAEGLADTDKDGDVDVLDAYATYNTQWGGNGGVQYDGVYSVDTTWYDENETEFTISTANELFGFAELVNSGTETFSGKTVKLGADINLVGSEWTPIGKVPEGSKNTDFTTSFKGTFDGNGYTVSNITVNNEKHAGLFGLVYAGSVTNVNVENVNITTKHWAGGIVGYLYGSVTDCNAKNVTINCVDETSTDGDKAGGIVGWTDRSAKVDYIISGNSVDNVKITANRDAGAIAGYVRERDTLVFEDNTATNVKLTASGYCPENKDVNIPTDAENNLIGQYAE